MNHIDTRSSAHQVTRPFSDAAALTSIAAGLLVLLGWRFGIVGPLAGPFGFRVMQPNTALAFLFGGLSLGCVVRESRSARLAARLFALAVCAVGVATLGEQLWGTRLELYRLLAPLLPAGANVALMSGVSGLCFGLQGLALLLQRTTRPLRHLGHLCAFASVLIAVIVLVDYTYNLTIQSRLISQSVMALHTSLTLIALGGGIMAADPEIGLVRVLSGQTAGSSLTRTMLPAVVLAPFGLGWLRLHAQRLGYLGTESGVAALAASSATVCAAIVLIYARRLDEIEATRSAAEQRVRESAQFHRQILDSVQEGIVVTDPESRFLLWNRAMEHFSGLAEAEVRGQQLRDMFAFFKDPRSFEAIGRVLRGEPAAPFDAQRPFSEASLWFSVNHTALRADSGEVTGVIVTYRDITAHKQAEEALVESSQFNQQVIDNLQDGVAVFDRELRFVAVNPFLAGITGLDLTGAIGRPVAEVYRRVRPQDLKALHDALDGRTTEWPDVRRIVKDQETWIWTRLSPLRRADGEITGVLGVTSDISERKRTEVALRVAQERTTMALAAAKMADWDVDLETKHITWSENLAVLFGRPLEAGDTGLAGSLKFAHPYDAPRLQQAIEHAVAQKSRFAVDFRIVLPDGQLRWLSAAGHVTEDGGRGPRLLGVTMDVTDRHLLEAQLRQAQKMDAVGQLAGGIAHDFNNLLTAILGYAQFLAESIDDARQARDVQEIITAANRAAALTRQLLDFSRRETIEVTTLAVNRTIGELTNMLQRLIGEQIHLDTILADDVRQVRANRGQVEQVLVNLVVNARDAMPDGGAIRIETSNVHLTENALERTLVRPGDYVRLTVSDTGCGIDEAVRARIFEPFFTTKDPGKGTGLGLATVYGIVTRAGGYVSVYSEAGHGATFKVFLPAAPGEDAPAATAVEAFEVLPVETSGLILVAEDEDAVRTLAVTILERAGYRVMAVRNPQEAEASFQQVGPEVALLLTDVIMPGGNGPDLHRRLSAGRAPLPVLYMSGYTGHGTLDQRRLEAGAPFLQKPFDAATLLRAVGGVLRG